MRLALAIITSLADRARKPRRRRALTDREIADAIRPRGGTVRDILPAGHR
jgi:hypothetical protein